MPKMLRDFECECGIVTEKYIDTNVHHIECECGKQAKRVVGMPHIRLDGTSGDFPSAHDHWAKIREDRHKILRKQGNSPL